MLNAYRTTIKHPGVYEGVGLHSGETTRLSFFPADCGEGILFFRKGEKGNGQAAVRASLENVIDTSLAVTLGDTSEGTNTFQLQTVEHLLYALFVLGITDIAIQVEGGKEIPIADGSAGPFIRALQKLEKHHYGEKVKPLVVTRPLSVTDGDRYLVATPANDFEVSYYIDYPHPLLKNQAVQLKYNDETFTETIGFARTFGFMKDVEYLRSRGLAQGGSVDNAVIYMPDGTTMNDFRFSGESVFHKILDLIGDLALIGRPIQGHVLGARGGHALDVAFGKKLLAAFG
ncbi:MAG: UDP-3-O-acyl-N-acetylglucosamine deacetylase [Turneriella sp.]|nr:UDP-3-O-acyl-N-acetylglucosamine deacetylase [Turneriella sp.]